MNNPPPSPHPAAPPSAVTTAAPAPLRILVVDDDVEICRLYTEILIRSGFHVDTAADGEAGWQVLHAARHAPECYDLLITDQNMPKLTGIQLVAKVRSARLALPVILATGAAVRQPEGISFAAILEKPFTSDELVHTVKTVLSAPPPR